MMRLHAGGPNRYYLCRKCGTVLEDVYRDGGIVAHRWHDYPDGALPESVREEATSILNTPHSEQLGLWDDPLDEQSQPHSDIRTPVLYPKAS